MHDVSWVIVVQQTLLAPVIAHSMCQALSEKNVILE